MKTFKNIFIEQEVSVGMGMGHVADNEDCFETLPDDTGHIHKSMVDKEGNGKTTSTIGDDPEHMHIIKNWQVLMSNDHTHVLDKKG